MILIANKKKLILPAKDVQNCRKHCSEILNKVKDVAERNNRYSYFLVFLLIMHIMTEDIISQFDPDVLEKIFIELDKKSSASAKPAQTPPVTETAAKN